MRDVAVIGVGMHKFGKFLDKSLKELTRVACWSAIKDAGIDPREIQIAYFSNSVAGLITGQEGIRGQVCLREVGISGIPIINVENACASGSTAFFGAWMAVASEFCDIALAIGSEKLFCDNTAKTTAALSSNTDVELEAAVGISFPGYYAMKIRRHMNSYGITPEQLAKVAVKNHRNGCLNPYAQHQKEITVEEVLNSKMIADPITLFMTAPISDGAAAVILCPLKNAEKFMHRPVIVASTVLRSGRIRDFKDESLRDITAVTAQEAYEKAGVGPEDIDVAEVHDAMAPAELLAYENLGFCKPGESGRMIDSGLTEINGKIPVNPSGGLSSKGHPVGATGLGQIVEIVWQLRGDASKRQIENAKVGLIQNGGGQISGEAAAMAVHILKI